MKVIQVPVSKINPAPYNPRKDLQRGDPEYETLKLAIQAHGFVDPLVWNETTGHLVGGHQRFKVLRDEMKMTAMWCSVVAIDDPKQEMALNLSLNKVGGEWDFQKLQAVLFHFEDDPEDGPLRMATGFSVMEFGQILDWRPEDSSADGLDKNPSQRLDGFNAGVIKQIVLYFDAKEYDKIVPRLEAVRAQEGVEDNTAAFVRLLESYENHHGHKIGNGKEKTRRHQRR